MRNIADNSRLHSGTPSQSADTGDVMIHEDVAVRLDPLMMKPLAHVYKVVLPILCPVVVAVPLYIAGGSEHVKAGVK